MINGLMTGLLSLVFSFFGLVLGPIVLTLSQTMGFDITQYTSYITSFLTQCASCFGWVVNATGLDLTLSLVLAWWSFVIVVGFPIWIIKVVLRWYRILMP